MPRRNFTPTENYSCSRRDAEPAMCKMCIARVAGPEGVCEYQRRLRLGMAVGKSRSYFRYLRRLYTTPEAASLFNSRESSFYSDDVAPQPTSMYFHGSASDDAASTDDDTDEYGDKEDAQSIDSADEPETGVDQEEGSETAGMPPRPDGTDSTVLSPWSTHTDDEANAAEAERAQLLADNAACVVPCGGCAAAALGRMGRRTARKGEHKAKARAYDLLDGWRPRNPNAFGNSKACRMLRVSVHRMYRRARGYRAPRGAPQPPAPRVLLREFKPCVVPN